MLKQIGSSTDKIISEAFPNYFFKALYEQLAGPFVEQHTHTLLSGKRQRKFEFKQSVRGAVHC